VQAQVWEGGGSVCGWKILQAGTHCPTTVCRSPWYLNWTRHLPVSRRNRTPAYLVYLRGGKQS
jgi:hypothetical protein